MTPSDVPLRTGAAFSVLVRKPRQQRPACSATRPITVSGPVDSPYLFFTQFHYIAFPPAAGMVTMCSVPTFFPRFGCAGCLSRPHPAQPKQARAACFRFGKFGERHTHRVSEGFFKGSIQSKGGEAGGAETGKPQRKREAFQCFGSKPTFFIHLF